MADWLDTADKVASIVGAASGVAGLVIAMRSNSRRVPPLQSVAAPTPPVTASLPAEEAAVAETQPLAERAPAEEPAPFEYRIPTRQPVTEPRPPADRGPTPAGPPAEPRPLTDRQPTSGGQPGPPVAEPVAPVAYGREPQAPQPTRPNAPDTNAVRFEQLRPGGPPSGRQYSAGTSVAALPHRSLVSSAGRVLGLLAFFAGTALLGAWLLSWLLSWLGGGSIGPWWLLAGMAVSYGLGLFFWFTELDGPGVVGLYVVWVPAAAWLLARTVVYHWFPDLFGNQGAWFVVVFVAVLLVGAAVGLRRSFSSR